MGKLLTALLFGTALYFGLDSLESKVYAEEMQKQLWKEIKKVKDLTPEEALRIKDSEKAWILSINHTCKGLHFTNYRCNEEFLDAVIDSLAEKFYPRIQFGKLNLEQLAERGASEDEILAYMKDNFNIPTPNKLPTTIMYKPGKFKSLEEKELWRKKGGPESEAYMDYWICKFTQRIDELLFEKRGESCEKYLP